MALRNTFEVIMAVNLRLIKFVFGFKTPESLQPTSNQGVPGRMVTLKALMKGMRTEFLNGELFGNMYEAEVLTKRWIRYYNEIRPHSSLNGKPPAPQSILPPSLGYCVNLDYPVTKG